MKGYLFIGSILLASSSFGAGWKCYQKNASVNGYHVKFYFTRHSHDTWTPSKLVVSKTGEDTLVYAKKEVRRTYRNLPEGWTGWRGRSEDAPTAVFMVDWKFGEALNGSEDRDATLELRDGGEVIASHNLTCEDYRVNN